MVTNPRNENEPEQATRVLLDQHGNPRVLLQDWGKGAWGVVVLDPDGRKVALVGHDGEGGG